MNRGADIEDPLLSGVHARIRQTFLLGLARQPLSLPPSLSPLLATARTQQGAQNDAERDPALALLILVGQRQRFVRPDLPALDPVPDVARRLHADPRPILPDNARRALRHLSQSVEKAYAGLVLSIAVRRIGKAGCRLCPFDLPSLAHHIKSDTDCLGLAERAYLAMTAKDGEDDAAKGHVFERITIENWTTFPKGHSAKFIADQRRDEPTAARKLLESVWKLAPAPVRVALLGALLVGLGPDDKAFLDGLAGDRAESVRQAALDLLARMPTTEAYEKRLAAAAACFKKTSTGLGRLMAAIGSGGEDLVVFAWPAGVVPSASSERLFYGLSLGDLAAAANLTEDDILAALPDDQDHILLALLESAAMAGDGPSAQRIVRHRLLGAKSLTSTLLWQLIEQSRDPLSVPDAEQLLASPAWQGTLSAFGEATPALGKDDGRLVLTATMMPRSAMPAFLATLAPLGPLATRAAKDFATLVQALPAPTVSTGLPNTEPTR